MPDLVGFPFLIFLIFLKKFLQYSESDIMTKEGNEKKKDRSDGRDKKPKDSVKRNR